MKNAKNIIAGGLYVTARGAEFVLAAIGAVTLSTIVSSLKNEGSFTLSITHKKNDE